MVTKHIRKGWDLLGLWNKRIIVIVGVISGTIYLTPKISFVVKTTSAFLRFQSNSLELEKDVSDLVQYVDVLTGLLMANMLPIDDNKYCIYVDRKRVYVQIREAFSGDKYIIITDGSTGKVKSIYACYWNKDQEKFCYTDFEGKYNLIYTY